MVHTPCLTFAIVSWSLYQIRVLLHKWDRYINERIEMHWFLKSYLPCDLKYLMSILLCEDNVCDKGNGQAHIFFLQPQSLPDISR